jgi:predicted SnoaL-like aldol condensation-catalyzing enzyme
MIKGARVIAGVVLAASLGTAAYAHDTAQEAANKKLVLDFYAQLEKPDMSQRAKEIAERYIAPGYIQHQEGATNGREAFARNTAGDPSAPPRPAMGPAKLLAIMAEGDKVIQVTSRDIPDPATGAVKPVLIWNMFRIENGQLAEHWDALPGGFRPPPGAK